MEVWLDSNAANEQQSVDVVLLCVVALVCSVGPTAKKLDKEASRLERLINFTITSVAELGFGSFELQRFGARFMYRDFRIYRNHF